MKKACSGFFNTLANKTRLAILYCLREGEKSVNEIVTQTGYEQSLVSHNLRLLRNCSFVEMRIDGKKRVYTLNKETITPLFDLVDKHQKHFCTEEKCTTCC